MNARKLFTLFAWFMLALFSAGLRAQAPAEPTVRQIYEAASGGDIRGAQQMIDQVIVAHPDSARAHFVKAELSARERDATTARAELATAERLAPGLPFARPDAVSALRAQVDALASAPAKPAPRPAQPPGSERRMGAPPPQPTASAGVPFGGILLAAVVGAVIYAVMRRRRAKLAAPAGTGRAGQPWGYEGGAAQPTFGRRGFDLDPPRRFDPGMAASGSMGPMGPQQGSMGSSIMRGVGTGLAVGAGALAAQEIGRRMFDHGRETQHDAMSGLGAAGAADSQIARDAGLGAFSGQPAAQDLGGQDFGIDGGGWDDGGGGGGDWEN